MTDKEIQHEKEWLQYHYDMWDAIVNALKEDSTLNVVTFKRNYIHSLMPNEFVECNCFLCDLYSCSECPLALKEGTTCHSDGICLYSIVINPNAKYSRVDAAEAIRDCVIDWR